METDKPLIDVGTYVQQNNYHPSGQHRGNKRYGKVIEANAHQFTVRWNQGRDRDYDASYLAEGAEHRIQPDERRVEVRFS